VPSVGEGPFAGEGPFGQGVHTAEGVHIEEGLHIEAEEGASQVLVVSGVGQPHRQARMRPVLVQRPLVLAVLAVCRRWLFPRCLGEEPESRRRPRGVK